MVAGSAQGIQALGGEARTLRWSKEQGIRKKEDRLQEPRLLRQGKARAVAV